MPEIRIPNTYFAIAYKNGGFAKHNRRVAILNTGWLVKLEFQIKNDKFFNIRIQ